VANLLMLFGRIGCYRAIRAEVLQGVKCFKPIALKRELVSAVSAGCSMSRLRLEKNLHRSLISP
jgi:hypothetical protein